MFDFHPVSQKGLLFQKIFKFIELPDSSELVLLLGIFRGGALAGVSLNAM